MAGFSEIRPQTARFFQLCCRKPVRLRSSSSISNQSVCCKRRPLGPNLYRQYRVPLIGLKYCAAGIRLGAGTPGSGRHPHRLKKRLGEAKERHQRCASESRAHRTVLDPMTRPAASPAKAPSGAKKESSSLTFPVLATAANELLARIHHRMPAILRLED